MTNTIGHFIDWSLHLPPDQEVIRQHTFHPSGRWTRLAVGGDAQSVLHYFEQHAVNQPNHLAIQSGQRQMTYAELNQRANQIAHALLDFCPQNERAVALLLDDNYDAIPAALATWKAGKFFVQLRPDEPSARLAHIVKDVQVGCLITSSALGGLVGQLASSALSVLSIDLLPAELDVEDPTILVTSEMTAVIKYTSGSTGQPKGVIQTHGHRLYDVAAANELYHIGPDDRFAIFILGAEFYCSLATGAAMILFDLYSQDMRELSRLLETAHITAIPAITTVFRHLADALPRDVSLPDLRLVDLTGEPTFSRDIEVFQRSFAPNATLSIKLGSQETLSYNYYLVDHQTPTANGRLSSGYSVPGIGVEVLDERGIPCPFEQPGEIVVSADHFVHGYWRNAKLSAKKFQINPGGPYRVSYCTGDLGYRLADSSLVHLGRVDSRLKIRGFTIEPVEVEQALLATSHWKEAIVSSWDDRHGEKHLVAWLVPAQQPVPSVTYLRAELGQSLPGHMIPSFFEIVDALSQLPNGKTDRRSLPVPTHRRPRLDAPFALSTTPFERLIRAIWSDILDLDEIGIHDPFLELGGNSLQAMRIAARVQDEFGVGIPLAELFAAGTVAEMALLLVAQLVDQAEATGVIR